ELQLELWEPGGVFQAKVTYEDTLRTREGMRTQVVKGTVKPDSLFLLTHSAKGIHYFPEADRSTMSNARYLAKLKSYYAFWATYVKDAKKTARMRQMRVLSVTISEARKDNLRETAQQVSTEAKDLFWFACEGSYRSEPQQV